MNTEIGNDRHSFKEMIEHTREALHYLLDHRSKKRPALNIVHYEPTPQKQAVPRGCACAFRVKIARGDKFDLIIADSEQTREAIIEDARKEGAFKIALSPDQSEATTHGLADRIYRLVRRFVKHLKKVSRRYRHMRQNRKTERYVRVHSHAWAG